MITKELFDQCQLIRDKKKTYRGPIRGVTKYPKIYQYICRRKMVRYNKKGIRYLACPKRVNGAFQHKCHERHTSLDMIEPQLEELLLSIIPPKKIREEMIKSLERKSKLSESERDQKLHDTLKQITTLKSRLEEISFAYANGELAKETFT